MPLSDLWPAWRAEWILHEDDDLIVVDKPPFVSTHAAEPDRTDDVFSRLAAYLQARDGRLAYLGIHQRLDRDTSGVLLFTRRKQANQPVAAQFEGRKVRKAYVAAVTGWNRGDEPGVLRHRLAPDRDGTVRVVDPRARAGVGQQAVTRYKALARNGEHTLVELEPLTGRTHQLRAQLSHVGTPIVGDVLYGGAPAERLHLHAASLTLQHPSTGEAVTFEAPVPEELGGTEGGASRDDPSPGPSARRAPFSPTRQGRGGDSPSRGRGNRDAQGRAEARPVLRRIDRPGRSGRSEAPLRSSTAALELPEPLTVAWVERKLRAAADRRYGLATSPATDAFRLCNGAGDGLPGVVVDRYGEHLVVSLYATGPSGSSGRLDHEVLLDAAHALGGAGVYVKVRPKHASVADPLELAPAKAVRGLDAAEPTIVVENGVRYAVRLGDGFATGLYFDQRSNRLRIRQGADGKRALNLFAYTCAFSVCAALGGASSTVSVDVSARALAWGRDNLQLNGIDAAKHTFVEADVVSWLARAAQRQDRFDLVVLDPPSFATTKEGTLSVEKDYRALAAAAMRLVSPEGQLYASVNHRGIVTAKLRRYLHEAARESGREVRQMKDLPHGTDYPPEPGFEPAMKTVLVTLG